MNKSFYKADYTFVFSDTQIVTAIKNVRTTQRKKKVNIFKT